MVDYYVDNETGDNGDDGLSLANAWATITYAVTQVSAGDTINIVTTSTIYTDSFTVGAIAGSAGSPITITGYTPLSPPTVTPGGVWYWDGASSHDYWDISYIHFTGYTSGNMIRFGSSSSLDSSNHTISYCTFNNNTECIRVFNGNNITVENCIFQDNTSGVAGTDSFDVMFDYPSTGSIVRYNWFEDNGSDSVHINNQEITSSGYEILVYGNAIWTNRSDSEGFTSSVRPSGWFDTSFLNRGENGIDMKALRRVTGNRFSVACWENVIRGYRDSVTGQDASGGSDGAGIVCHLGAQYALIDRNIIHDCNVGINSSVSTPSNITITNNLIFDITDDTPETTVNTVGTGIKVDSVSGLIIDNNTVYACDDYVLYVNGGGFYSVRNNLFTGGSSSLGDTSRSGSPTGESEFDYNAWHNLIATEPSQWQGTNDVTITTLGVDNTTYYTPSGSSDALDAGVNAGHPHDIYKQPRSLAPSLGGGEDLAADDSNVNVLNFAGHRAMLRDFWDTSADSNKKINVVPVRGQPGAWGLAFYFHGIEAKLTKDVTRTKRFRIAFYITTNQVNHLTDGSYVQVVRCYDGAEVAANQSLSVDVLRTGSTLYIRARTRADDGTTDHYAGGSSGFALPDVGRHLIEIDCFYAANSGDDNGSIEAWLNGTSQGSATGIDNDSQAVDTIQVGLMSYTTQEDNHDWMMVDSLRANNNGETIGAFTPTDPALPVVQTDDANLEAYYPHNESSGNATDESANGNTLTDNNTVTRTNSGVTVIHGTYVADFELSNSEYFNIADGSQTGLDLSTTGTIVTVVNPEQIGPSSQYMYLVSKYDTSSNRSYALAINASGFPRLLWSTDGSAFTETVGDMDYQTSTTYFLAATWSTTSGLVHVYTSRVSEDLPLIAHNAAADAIASGLYNSSADFILGARGDATPTRFLDGYLDYTLVFSRELSPAEIQSIYEDVVEVVETGTTSVITDNDGQWNYVFGGLAVR